MGGTSSKTQNGGMVSTLPYELNEKILSYLNLPDLQSVVDPNSDSPYNTKKINFQSMLNDVEYAIGELARVGKEKFIEIWTPAIPAKSRERVWSSFWNNIFSYIQNNINSIWEDLKEIEEKTYKSVSDEEASILRREFINQWTIILPTEYQFVFWQTLYNFNNEQKFDAFHPEYVEVLQNEYGISLDEPYGEDRFISENYEY